MNFKMHNTSPPLILCSEVIRIDSFKLTSLVTLIANAIATLGFSAEELTLLTVILTQLGDTLSTIATLESISGTAT